MDGDGFNMWPQYGSHLVQTMTHDEAQAFERKFSNILLLQGLHSRIHGFPTSGCALNTFALLLQLCKPLKLETIPSISAFYPLREDVAKAWQKELRFGDKDQVDAAAGGSMAKADPGFTSPPSDKALFKTQVFWLASKGVDTFFVPVAKEAYHTMQNVMEHFWRRRHSRNPVSWSGWVSS